ncbi:MAG TPA: TIGR02530 family flagellar biosynthesis protein [Balneolaceae bacterium]|nr:TIGR02530 family flagellar biosynthesis protein [Balneolaceae bacterium]
MNIQHLTGRVDPNKAPQKQSDRASVPQTPGDASFKEVLQNQNDLQFSGHALQRLKDRSITMNKRDMKRLKDAVTRAEKKGGRDSLVMDGDRAFLVNIPNKKVITAVDMMELRDKVFTNIDSTVLTKKYGSH